MEKEQEKEWAQAQDIELSVDLVEGAKNQLKFLTLVDCNRYLYDGPSLDRAIYRYNVFWLPLLAKHLENPISDDPLVVPLDCEWIWHCHRLNPIRYKSDCEALFGKILGNHNIVSTIEGTSKTRSEEIWNEMYPEEPYEFDFSRLFQGNDLEKNFGIRKFTSYDLVSAVQRQVPFCYQVSRPHMSNDQFLQEALARYKGFLHLIKTNKNNNIKRFSVPTYDIDLIWHSHQLSPIAYCNDLYKLLGKVLEHDDTDSDRSKGQKLDTGFSETTRQFEETFGLRYFKAGAMYRGNTPTPVTQTPCPFTFEGKKCHDLDECDNLIQFSETNGVELLLEFIEIKNLPESYKKGNIYISFRKKQADKLFYGKRTLRILPESKKKQVTFLQCEPNGEFLFEILYQSPSKIPLPKSFIQLGSCSFSLQDSLVFGSQLFISKWLPLTPMSDILATDPILLHVSLSYTPPKPAIQVFHIVQSQNFFNGSCFLPFSKIGKAKNGKNWACVMDDDGNDVLGLKMRDLSKDMKKTNPHLLKEVYYVGDSGETHTLAELHGNEWCVKGTNGHFKLSRTYGTEHLFELVGHNMVKLFPGRRLDYETKQCGMKTTGQDYVTAIEFSTDYPYGRAVGLIDFKHGTFEVKDGWMILTGIIVSFILSEVLRREGGFDANVGFMEKKLNRVSTSPDIQEAKVALTNGPNAKESISNCGGCGGACGGCGGGCGSMASENGGGGCGSGCGGGCGGCGGGCGSKAAGCGGGCGGCGGGCGSMVAKSSGGCGSGCGGCGGGFGNMAEK